VLICAMIDGVRLKDLSLLVALTSSTVAGILIYNTQIVKGNKTSRDYQNDSIC
jgi:hypothetical protein